MCVFVCLHSKILSFLTYSRHLIVITSLQSKDQNNSMMSIYFTVVTPFDLLLNTIKMLKYTQIAIKFYFLKNFDCNLKSFLFYFLWPSSLNETTNIVFISRLRRFYISQGVLVILFPVFGLGFFYLTGVIYLYLPRFVYFINICEWVSFSVRLLSITKNWIVQPFLSFTLFSRDYLTTTLSFNYVWLFPTIDSLNLYV